MEAKLLCSEGFVPGTCGEYEQQTRRGGGEVTPIYRLYRYAPPNRVWFLRFSTLIKGINFFSFWQCVPGAVLKWDT